MVESQEYASAARELIRAVRGKRSQVALSRRLGYRGNPVTDWEAGRSHPDALEILEAARAAKLPITAAFERFHPAPAPKLEHGASGLSFWLNQVRGSTSFAALAERMGCSRYAVRRWFAADTHVKLPAFLHLVDAMTDRVQELVAELVAIEQVPTLRERFMRVQLAKRLAFELPWSEAILRVLETTAHEGHAPPRAELIAKWLDVAEHEVLQALSQMTAAGIIRNEGDTYTVVGTLSVDTRVQPDGMRQLRQHWLGALSQRAKAPHPGDWAAYNVVSVSATDLEFIRERLQAVYREIRARVAASQPPQEVALVMLQLAHWEAPDGMARTGSSALSSGA